VLDKYKEQAAKLRLQLQLAKNKVLHWSSAFKKERSIDFFQKNYHYSTAPKTLAWIENAQNCISCSLCTFSCSAIKNGTAPVGYEPKQLVLWISKNPNLEVSQLENIPCVECAGCVVECPRGVPIHQLGEALARVRGLS